MPIGFKLDFKYFISIMVISITLLNSCANIKAPSGGVRDTTAAKIVRTIPDNFQTNFKGNQISIYFDKYMDKSKFIEGTYISPENRLSFDWSGKTLTLTLLDSLKPETTYSIVFDPAITDYLGNKLGSSYNFLFSTGEHIDKGQVEGELIDEIGGQSSTKNDKSVSIFAYFLGTDSLSALNKYVLSLSQNGLTKDTILKNIDYFGKVSDNGKFSLNGLKNGFYLVTAVSDRFLDKVYSPESDRLAMPSNLVHVIDSLPQKILLKLNSVQDKSLVRLNSAELKYILNIDSLTKKIQPNLNKIFELELTFSKPLDVTSIGKYSLMLSDTGKTTIFFPLKVEVNKGGKKQLNKVNVYFEGLVDSLEPKNNVFVVTALNEKNEELFRKNLVNGENNVNLLDYFIKDTLGNYLDTLLSSTQFMLSSNTKVKEVEKKQIQVFIDDAEVIDSLKAVDLNPRITLIPSSFLLFPPVRSKIEEKQMIKLTNIKTKRSELLQIDNFFGNYIDINLLQHLNKGSGKRNKLDVDTWYELTINVPLLYENVEQDFDGIKIDWAEDTLHFLTKKTNNLSMISGSFEYQNDKKNSNSNENEATLEYILIFKNTKSDKKYSLSVKNGGKWLLDGVESGEYQIEVVKDTNLNGIFDFGQMNEFGVISFSEEFFILPNTINVKENWDLEDVKISI